MRVTWRGPIVIAASAVLSLAALIPLAAPVSAVPIVTLTGSAPAVVSGPATVTFSYSLVLPTAVTSAQFSTHQDVHLPASSTGVNLDNAAVPPAQITQSGVDDIVVDAGPAGLTAGTHLLTFSAAVPAGASATTSSSLSVAYQDPAAKTVSSGAVIVAINQPDLAIALTPDSGEDPGSVGPVGTGRLEELVVDVTNVGYGAPNTSMLISLPVGLGLSYPGVARDNSDEDAPLLPCAATPADPQQVLCQLGPIPHTGLKDDATIEIPLISGPNPPVGTTAPITVSIAPADATQGVDTNPTNNSVQFPIKFTGKAKLSYKLSTVQTAVPVGSTTQVKVTVTNNGPNVAANAFGFVAVEHEHLTVVGFTGKTLSLTGGTGSGVGGVSSPKILSEALASRVKHHKFGSTSAVLAAGGSVVHSATIQPADAVAEAPGVIWLVGSIPIGRSVSAVVTLKAKTTGSDKLALILLSDAADPACPNLECNPPELALKVVAEVAATTTPVSTPTTPAGSAAAPLPAGGGTALADTGEESSAQLTLAAGLLMMGAALLLLSRRARPVHLRRH